MTTLAVLPLDDLAPWRQGAKWEVIFAAWAAGLGRSQNTVTAYHRWLSRFFHLTQLEYAEDIRAGHLAAFRKWVTDHYPSRSTRAQALSAVRALVAYVGAWDAPVPGARKMRVLFANPKGSGKIAYQVLTPAEREALLEVADQDAWETTVNRTPHPYLLKKKRSEARRARDTALIMLALGCGLRASELVGLQLDGVRSVERGMVVDVLGKGEKWRTVPVPGDASREVYRYLDATARKLGESTGPLILSEGKAGGAIGRAAVGKILKGLLRRAGVKGKKLSPHSLRHTYAMECLRSGMGIEALSKLLGHAQVNTTMVYLGQLETDTVVVPDVRARMPEETT